MSSKARLVITAVVVEKRPVAQVSREYGVSRSWVYELLARYRDEGATAFQARSRRPKTSPRATPPATVEMILELRKGKRARKVPLIAEVRELVTARVAAAGPDPSARLFADPQGGRITTAVLRDATHWDEV
jgi:transposase